jgi:hypothetical protein
MATVSGHKIDELIEKIEIASSKREAWEAVGNYLIDSRFGVGRRAFDYQTPFPKAEPGCAPKFSRLFQHSDWRDGQDLVQAEQSAGEDGFNFRFHQIEKDLDNLRDDVRTLFECVANMRAALFDRFGELKTEIGVINTHIEECCGRTQPGTFEIDVNEIFKPRFAGGVNWFGKEMNVFETDRGVVLIPKVSPIDSSSDSRVTRVADLGKVLERSRKIKNAFRAGPLSKESLVKDFGDIETDDGTPLKDLLDILPEKTTYASPDTLLKAVAEREAAAIRTSGLAADVIGFELGSDVAADGGQPLATSGLDTFERIPEEARTVLIATGVGTLGDLAKIDPKKLSADLKREGVDAPTTTAAEWVAAARTIVLIR